MGTRNPQSITRLPIYLITKCEGGLLSDELCLHQLTVEGRRSEKTFVRAALDDAPFVEDDDAVDSGDGGQPVRDDQRSRPIVERPQSELHDRLELLVERAGGLVENQDTGASEDRSRDRQSLTLAAGQLDAAIADWRVVSIREAIDELVGAGELGGRHDLAIGGATDAVRDVLADAAREQRWILQHRRYPAAEPRRVELAHVTAADADAPFIRIVEAQQQ